MGRGRKGLVLQGVKSRKQSHQLRYCFTGRLPHTIQYDPLNYITSYERKIAEQLKSQLFADILFNQKTTTVTIAETFSTLVPIWAPNLLTHYNME